MGTPNHAMWEMGEAWGARISVERAEGPVDCLGTVPMWPGQDTKGHYLHVRDSTSRTLQGDQVLGNGEDPVMGVLHNPPPLVSMRKKSV